MSEVITRAIIPPKAARVATDGGGGAGGGYDPHKPEVMVAVTPPGLPAAMWRSKRPALARACRLRRRRQVK